MGLGLRASKEDGEAYTTEEGRKDMAFRGSDKEQSTMHMPDLCTKYGMDIEGYIVAACRLAAV